MREVREKKKTQPLKVGLGEQLKIGVERLCGLHLSKRRRKERGFGPRRKI